MWHTLAVALHEPVVALAQLFVGAVALDVARRARKRAAENEKRLVELERPAKPPRRRSASSSKPLPPTPLPDPSLQAKP